MTTAAAHTIQCPSCSKSYQIKAGTAGRLRCSACDAVFSVGGQQSQRAASRRKVGRDKADQQMAVRLMVVGGVLLLMVAVGVATLGGKKSPGAGDGRSEVPVLKRSTSRPSRQRAGPPDGWVQPDHPRQIQLEFLKAIASGDEAVIRKWFLFDEYFDWAARKYEWEADDERRYDRASPEKKKELEELVLDELLSDTEMTGAIKSFLLPGLANETLQATQWDAKPDHAYWDYLVTDDQGRKLFSILIRLRLRKGMSDDPYSYALNKNNWGVWQVKTKYHTSSVRSSRPERSAVDQVIGSLKKKEQAKAKKKRIAKRSGRAEADPSRQEPLEGTSGRQMGIITGAIRTLQDGRSAAREVNDARTALVDSGRVAIPFLLNALVDKDHKQNEQDILACMPIITALREITGESFGYGPPTNAAVMGGMGLGGATPEQRTTAVRRWFGWWKNNKDTWSGRKPDDEGGSGREPR